MLIFEESSNMHYHQVSIPTQTSDFKARLPVTTGYYLLPPSETFVRYRLPLVALIGYQVPLPVTTLKNSGFSRDHSQVGNHVKKLL